NTSAPLSLLTSRLISSPPRIPRENATAASTPHAHLPPPLPAPSVTTGAMGADASAVAAPAHSATVSEDPELAIDSDSENESYAYRKDKVVEKTKKKRKDGNELSPEMDDMITLARVTAALNVFGLLPDFTSAAIGQFPTIGSVETTSRTVVLVAQPSYRGSASFALVELPKPPPVPQRSRIKAYKATAQVMNLRDAAARSSGRKE
ncbi:hypothetical protein B0H14DRAFT_3619941, partial [Mycena olivaceomarginata]